MVGHLVDAVVRDVRDDDAALGGGGEVDRVDADAVAGDDLAALETLDHLARHERVAVDDAERLAGELAQPPGLAHVALVDERVPGGLDQLALEVGPAERVIGDEYEVSHGTFSSV